MAESEGTSVLEKQAALMRKFDKRPPLPGYSSNVILMFQESWGSDYQEEVSQKPANFIKVLFLVK